MPSSGNCWAMWALLVSMISPSRISVPMAIISAFTRRSVRPNEGLRVARGSVAQRGHYTLLVESPVTPGTRRDSVRLLTTLRVVHPFPSFLVAGLTVALVPLANADAGLGLYLSLGIGMLLFQFAIGLVNDLVDSAD